MRKPVIGISSFRTDSSLGYHFISVTEAYFEAIYAAGALPVILPVGLSNTDLDTLRGSVDGIILTGGGDINPDLFKGEPHPRVARIDDDRDRADLHLAKSIIDNRVPFLAICRGMQVLNVCLGGTLYTHVSDQHPGADRHDYWPEFPRDRISHPIRVEEGSTLSEILGQPIVPVNSLHHQGIRDLADGLKPTAYAPDGLIEAVELENHPFGLAVQWHPEWLTAEHSMPALFDALVKAAQNGV
jgi:putative glutamine amidotransferase